MSDYLFSMVAIAFLGITGITIFNKAFPHWDEKFLIWFSNIASTPAWSVCWFFIIIAWLSGRMVLYSHYPWFKEWGDNILITILFSCSPYVVENAMKYSTQITTQEILKLSESTDKALERLEESDKFIKELLNKLLEAIEDREDNCDDLRPPSGTNQTGKD